MNGASAALMKKLDPASLPRHVAIIMDGNGRWAEKRGLPRIFGHRAGVKTVDRIVTAATDIGLPALTLYSFSTENWNRPRREVNMLMGILKKYLMKEMPRMVDNNIRFNAIGRLRDLPESAVECVEKVKDATKNGDGTILTLALSYGSRREIADAARRLAERVGEGSLDPRDITPELFETCLDTADLPEVDLLIRTSGELRVSNFLLWQIAYAELYFSDVMWPDFSNADFLNALLSYQKRERRFGLAGNQLARAEDDGRKPAALKGAVRRRRH